MSLVDRLSEHAALRPDAPFLVTDEVTLSWAETVDRVGRLASLLHDEGVRLGDRVALTGGNNALFVLSWFATRWLGAVSVPLHTRTPDAKTVALLADAEAVLHLTDRKLGPTVADAAPVLELGPLTELDSLLARQPFRQGVTGSSRRPASLLYTSGTTGPPKGAVVSEAAQLRAGERLADAIGLRPDDRMALCLPLFHTNPQIYGVMTAVHTGGSVAVLRSFSAATFFEQADRLGATCFSYVGTVLHELATVPVRPQGSRLRLCVGGGAPADVWRAVEDRHQVEVFELYGMTETAGWVTCNTVGNRRFGSCGRARSDVAVSVVDGDDRPLPSGQTGEIVVRPLEPGVLFDGYNGRPDLTATRTRNLWFHTGDLGSIDDEGFLYFGGRADDQIRRGGENVEPSAVEAVLARLPDVQEVVVVAVPDDRLGSELKAVVAPAVEIDVDALLRACDRDLPSFAWPRYLEMRDSLPKTATEKVARHELRTVGPDDLDLRGAISSYFEARR